jgi:hypothetical protein
MRITEPKAVTALKRSIVLSTIAPLYSTHDTVSRTCPAVGDVHSTDPRTSFEITRLGWNCVHASRGAMGATHLRLGNSSALPPELILNAMATSSPRTVGVTVIVSRSPLNRGFGALLISSCPSLPDGTLNSGRATSDPSTVTSISSRVGC